MLYSVKTPISCHSRLDWESPQRYPIFLSEFQTQAKHYHGGIPNQVGNDKKGRWV
mgnify:CR=1 FL=1